MIIIIRCTLLKIITEVDDLLRKVTTQREEGGVYIIAIANTLYTQNIIDGSDGLSPNFPVVVWCFLKFSRVQPFPAF